MELLINNHTVLLDIRRNALADQESTVGQHQSVSAVSYLPTIDTDRLLDSNQVSGCEHRSFGNLCLHSVPLGEVPPPPPRACFGRDEVIEMAIGFAESLGPVALIGAGGLGKHQ